MPAGGIELNDDQLKRLSNLTPAFGERHDKANMASIELTASGRTFMLPPLVAPIRRRLGRDSSPPPALMSGLGLTPTRAHALIAISRSTPEHYVHDVH